MKVVIDGITYIPEPPKVTDNNLEAALNIRFDSDAGNNTTIRDYFYKLLETLWSEGECFSGKRPFGNSGWEYELYTPLIRGGFIKGQLDQDGYIANFDQDEAIQFVFSLIEAVFYGD